MIAHAKKYKVEVFVSTNLNILSAELAEGLVKSNLDKLLISMDGFSQETYGQYFRRGNLDRVLSNIEMLVEKRKGLNASRPELQIRFLVFSHNEHEISIAESVAKRLGVDRLELVPIRLDMGMEILERKEDRVRKHQKWLPNDANLNRYQNRATTIRPATCSKPWRETTINWDGSVSPCCSVFAKVYDFGHALEGGFRKVWNSQKYLAARRILGRNGVLDPTHICAICKENGFLDF